MATRYDILVHTEAAFGDGLKKGRVEGKIEGKAEEKADNAKALLREDVNPEIVARALGLSLEMVGSLRE